MEDKSDNRISFINKKHCSNFSWIEILIVIIFSSITSFFILRTTLLSSGVIAIRDTTPIFYNRVLASNLGLSNTSNLIGFMYLTGYPVSFLFRSNFISLQTYQKISYFLFPFFLGQISVYYSIRYFAKKYIIQFRGNIQKVWFILPALLISFIYVVEPIPAYFSFWSYFSTFIAFAPALIAATDYAFSDFLSREDLIKRSVLLSIIWAISIGDPRTFVYSFMIVIIILIYRILTKNVKRLQLVGAFITTLLIFLGIESRVIFVLYIGLKTNYLNIASSINSEQQWALTYFFSIKQVLNGTSMYWGWVSYSSLSILAIIPFIVVIVYIFIRKNDKFVKLLFAFLILIMFIVSNTFELGFILSSFVNIYLKNYIYIFFPMYLISLIPPIMVILFSLGIFSLLALFVDLHKIKENSNTIKKKFIKWIPLVVVIFILASQLAFTYPTYASGDYQGLYKPVDPPQPMINAGIFLENSTGYNAIVAPSVQYPPPATIWNSTYSLLQLLSTYKNSLGINAYTANNSEFLTHIYYLGVQHLVIINIYNNYQPIINKALNSSSLSLSFHQGFIFIFTVNSFKQILQSRGLFLDFNYPFSNVLLDQWNSTIVNLPYFGQNISPKYVDGVIGINITILDLIALFSSNYSINLYNIVHRYSSNPSSPGSNWGCDISYFPSGAEGIAINGEFNRTVAFDYSQGKYIVLVNGFTFQPPKPSDKNYSLLSICSGNEKITANFASLSLPYYQSSIWIDSGSINSTGLIYLKNNGPLYITSIRMIPVIQYNILRNEAISFAQNISIISAEHSKGCLGKLISNYTYSRNTTLYEYPYLVIRLEPSRANPVTLIINPGSNTFGVPDRILQSPEPIYTKYYIDTTYYSIVLGSRYNFSEYGIVNPFYIGMLNIFTLSLVIVIPSAGIRIIDKRKGISEKKKIKSW